MIKIKLIGDHSSEHCGCAAVIDTLKSHYQNVEWISENDEAEYDAVLVNGEGTMHHTRAKMRKRAQSKMAWLQHAIDENKPAYLVNTVWQENSVEFTPTLRKLDFISVRERLSKLELGRTHKVRSILCPDLSYFRQIDEAAEAPDWSGKILYTDFYVPTLQTWMRPTTGPLTQFQYVDMRDHSWSQFVRGLRTAQHLITGRHHAMYAACKARLPFTAIKSNTFKNEGLLSTAKVNLYAYEAPRPLDKLLSAAERRTSEYEKLFAWLDAQTIQLPILPDQLQRYQSDGSSFTSGAPSSLVSSAS